ncbi:MAG: leucine-rich repeat protein [Clostridia bacterium]|nr:leucine-rich repeat protein [Clostridia bacterium]
MKRFICALLAISLLFALCACEENITDESVESSDASIEEIVYPPETPGEDFKYLDLEDGSGISIEYYYGGDETVVIPEKIDGKAVKEVRISNFGYNEKMKELYIPEGVTKLSSSNFVLHDEATTTVEKIVLPKSLKEIESYAFFKFKNLSYINLPDGMTKLGSQIFYGCTSLTEAYLPKECFNNGYGTLTGCCIKNIVIPEGITGIGYAEFGDAAVEKITLPSTITEIGYCAFLNCPIEEITLPEGLLKIDDRAFSGTKLKEAVIPKSVKEMTELSFSDIDGFERLVFLGDAPSGFTDWVSHISEPSDFYEIHISKSAQGFSFPRWNGFPVRYTDSSEMPKVYNGFEYYETESGITVTKYLGNDTNIIFPESIDGKAITAIEMRIFSMDKNIKSVTLPDTVEFIGARAFFGCDSLESVAMPKNLKEIGDYAISSCDLLSEIIVPQGVEKIGKEAFSSNRGMTRAVLPNGIKEWGSGMFSNCYELVSVTLPDDMTEIPDGMFFATRKLTEIELPEGITKIGESAFRSSDITELTLPDGVKSIGDYAFESAFKIKSLNLPEGLTYIGEEAFESSGITELVIPKSLETFWGWTFNCCFHLQSITFLGDAPEIEIYSYESYDGSIEYRDFPNNTEFTVYINEGAKGFNGDFWDRCNIVFIKSEEGK